MDIMQGLSWWLYEADVVAHAVHEETGMKAGCGVIVHCPAPSAPGVGLGDVQ